MRTIHVFVLNYFYFKCTRNSKKYTSSPSSLQCSGEVRKRAVTHWKITEMDKHLNGFSSFDQALAVHFLHGGTCLWGFGEFHKRNSFRLFRLFVFYNPNVLDFTERGKTLPDCVLGDGFAGDQKQSAVWGIIQIRRRPVVVLHFHCTANLAN